MEKLIDSIAFELHEGWRRKNRFNLNGIYSSRWKPIKDEEFLVSIPDNYETLPKYLRQTKDGSYEIDIANASYFQLSPDWQTENRAAAEVVSEIVASGKELSREEIGDIIHNAWLDRNSWGKNDKILGKPFAELPKEEQEKDLDQYDIALTMSQAVVLKGQYGDIDGSIKNLEEAKARGHNVAINFDETMLFSEFDTLNTAYLKHFGMTKLEQFLVSIEEYKENLPMMLSIIEDLKNETEKGIQAEKQYVFKNIESWKKRGEALIYPEKIGEWHKQVERALTSTMNSGKNIETAIKIMEALESSNVDLNQIIEVCNKIGPIYNISKLVLYFSKRGPEFFRELNKGNELSQAQLKYIEEIEKYNEEKEADAKKEHSKDDRDSEDGTGFQG